MIWFLKHKNPKSVAVGPFTLPKGAEILKICFSKKDIHISRSGMWHLDIWGSKLEELKKLLS